ncbi:MAG: D-alanyl-D-alanine dipeptidase, partial [Duncaniella sp.]|nr:D-alanyl-D-alanine dipeptidase [Duncaniella sp.]
MKISLLTTAVLMISWLSTQARGLEEIFAERGYVSVTAIEPDIMVSLMYARDDNFTGVVLYDDGIKDAWLHPDAAKALAKAQRELSSLMPGCHLLVKDAARPMSVQRRMFNAVKGTPKA